MKLALRHGAIGAALIAVLAATAGDQWVMAPAPVRNDGGAMASAQKAAADWPREVRALAGALLEKYGAPDQALASQLSWDGRRPWTKVVLFRDSQSPGRPNHLLEAVAYGPVPFNRWRQVSALGANYDPTTQELSARTNGEETNLLALNLADEIVRGKRDVSAARGFYDATMRLSLSGKSSPYMRRLLFSPRPRTLPPVDGAKKS